ncbi:MAG: DNA repair protein RecO C-terminal domain-containing protein [Bacteroidales bacterium]|nr:DNA repair protein RecO C-terminal domain-containing protein [Candidatus Physcousia equi]
MLHTLRYGDDAMVVDVLTESRGCVTFLVRIPKTRKAPAQSLLLRPLAVFQLELDYRANRQMQRVRNLSVDSPYVSIPYEPTKNAVALFLAEVLYYALRREETPNVTLFAFLEQSLRWFDLAESHFVNFHVVFLIKLTRYLGFWPTEEELTHDGLLTPLDAEWVDRLLRFNYQTMRVLQMTREQRNRLLDIICSYYTRHVADFPEVRSLGVLREMFQPSS